MNGNVIDLHRVEGWVGVLTLRALPETDEDSARSFILGAVRGMAATTLFRHWDLERDLAVEVVEGAVVVRARFLLADGFDPAQLPEGFLDGVLPPRVTFTWERGIWDLTESVPQRFERIINEALWEKCEQLEISVDVALAFAAHIRAFPRLVEDT